MSKKQKKEIESTNDGSRAINKIKISDIVIMAILIVFKHWSNIKRLFNGTESKFSFKKSVKAPEKNESKEEK